MGVTSPSNDARGIAGRQVQAVGGLLGRKPHPTPSGAAPPKGRDIDGPSLLTLVDLLSRWTHNTRLIAFWRSNMPRSRTTARTEENRTRGARLGFRVDDQTKELVERAAELERRNLTDFCLTALTEAAEKTIARHETLMLSERDRQVFFDTLINPPKPNARLKRAFKAERGRVAP